MAKRRRLVIDPAPIQRLSPHAPEAPARPSALSAPPIAAVAGEAAAAAALAEVTGALEAARAEGRLIQPLPLEAIDEHHLVRDRLPGEDEAFEALVESLRARGQQTPIEVVQLDEGRYGLISGWRRLRALRRLHEETGEARFASVLAVLRRPSDASEAYVAMVEENEIRAGLSHYERARIVFKAVGQGVYATEKQALNGLFGSVSRSRRSKIKSFIPIVATLDGVLRFPTHLGERLGLELGRELTDAPGLARDIAAALEKATPQTPEAEQEVIAQVLALHAKRAGEGAAAEAPREATPAEPAPPAVPEAPPETDAPPTPGITLRFDATARRLTLSGPGVDAELAAELRAWLASRAG
ncbi:ParB/RepB/Spo0J family partition protein [Meinhardsimonia xiamenensis]|jgi:ParB/RepB/Spo0J family partition protein|uniref:ParB/RepB/Spo0J family partition protein n=1 Tax=Meinhardsimonia xiamenensis TaxID=990712 RepID=A0A1G9HDX6_9RHOB|nr:ParB N-terminal domain-containing protein [Meinhardsimonia xiamenensis]PRX28372.1 ParB/RepB/Spo0J family partition protein [Meinhardsimonia xiamenensis]SDL11117.1 ParB/RepB/Spo0J family partition protein [Meinhardsimonia xiamenensis]